MNETIRDYLKRRVRWCMGIAICGWVLIPLSMSANKVIPEPFPQILGFLLFGGAILAMQRVAKCPKCKANLAKTVAMPIAFEWGSGPKIGFCPYCGVNLDEPVPGMALESQNPIK